MQIHQYQPAFGLQESVAALQQLCSVVAREFVQRHAELDGGELAIRQWRVLGKPFHELQFGMALGRRVSEQFRRYNLPITPYDLRHAWAVRTIHIGLPDTVAARMMGHSVAIHTRTYHHWITRRDQQQAVDTALARQRA